MDFLFKSFQEPRAKRTFQTKSKKDCSFEIIDENPNEDHKSVMKKTRPRKFSFEELHATQVRDDSKIVSTDPNKKYVLCTSLCLYVFFLYLPAEL